LLNELEELLELTQPTEFANVVEPLFGQIGKCLNSPHFQVAERALLLWNNEYIVSLVAKCRESVLPCVFGALQANGNHWNTTVHGLTFSVIKLFKDMDDGLWNTCKRRWESEQSRLVQGRSARKEFWKQLEEQYPAAASS